MTLSAMKILDNGNGWIRYSTLGIEMAVIVGGFVWGGVALDKHQFVPFPLFTILFSFLGLTIAIVRLVRGVK